MKKKNLLLVCALACVGVAASAAALSTPVTASAQEIAPAPAPIVMNGRSIRYLEPTGLRFRVTVQEDIWDSLGENAKAGCLFAKKSAEDVELTFENAYEAQITGWVEESQSERSFNAVLYNIPDTDYAQDIVARGYIVSADGKTSYFAEQVSASVVEIANYALNASPAEEHVETLENYVDAVVESFSVAETSLTLPYNYTGSALQLEQTMTLNAGYVNATVPTPWASSNEDVVTVDEDGLLTIVGKGDATVSVVVGSNTVSIPVSIVDPVLLDFSSAAVLDKVHATHDATSIVYDEEGQYVTYFADETVTTTSTKRIKIDRTLTDEVIQSYKYVHLSIKGYNPVATTEAIWTLYMCNNTYAEERMDVITWRDIYVPTEIFVNTYKGWFLGGSFRGGNYFSGISFKGLELTNDAVILDPTTGVGMDKLSKSNANVTQTTVKGSASDPYTGDYVQYTGASGWCNVNLTHPHIGPQASNYKVEIWVYYGATKDGELTAAFFKSTNYQRTFNANTWTKITFTANEFSNGLKSAGGTLLALYIHGGSYVPSGASMTEVRIGTIKVVDA